MTDNDCRIIETLMASKQQRTKAIVSAYLHRIYPKDAITETDDFIYCKGTIPIGLVCHLDTVYESYRHDAELYYDVKKQVMFCPGYPGFDDKAGVFSILKLLRMGYRPSLLFCCDEEIGGKGAQELAQTIPRPQLKYLIELDRAGFDDIVYYQCGNAEFQQYTQQFGFTKQRGSFTDISFISPVWDIASCNISCGYLDEHTDGETLHIDWMERTIGIVGKMLDDAENAKFFDYQSTHDMALSRCEVCKEKMFDFETIIIDNKKICCYCAEKYWGIV